MENWYRGNVAAVGEREFVIYDRESTKRVIVFGDAKEDAIILFGTGIRGDYKKARKALEKELGKKVRVWGYYTSDYSFGEPIGDNYLRAHFLEVRGTLYALNNVL